MLGLLQVATGYGKKLMLADNLTPYIESRDLIFSTISLEERWLLLVALNLRIYFDFSGYSDIAIGLARMMGIEVPANFNWPYLSTSIREFWRRWKILGADSAVIGKGFKPDDYLDMGHFSETGGSLVAHMVAEKIRKNAQRLDYE